MQSISRPCRALSVLARLRAAQLRPIESDTLDHLKACSECMEGILEERMNARSSPDIEEEVDETCLPRVGWHTPLWLDQFGFPCASEPEGPSVRFSLFRLIYRDETYKNGTLRLSYSEGEISVYEVDEDGGTQSLDCDYTDVWLLHHGFRYVRDA